MELWNSGCSTSNVDGKWKEKFVRMTLQFIEMNRYKNSISTLRTVDRSWVIPGTRDVCIFSKINLLKWTNSPRGISSFSEIQFLNIKIHALPIDDERARYKHTFQMENPCYNDITAWRNNLYGKQVTAKNQMQSEKWKSSVQMVFFLSICISSCPC